LNRLVGISVSQLTHEMFQPIVFIRDMIFWRGVVVLYTACFFLGIFGWLLLLFFWFCCFI
jgi:hypothetical protein